jgi:hypothetical protein
MAAAAPTGLTMGFATLEFAAPDVEARFKRSWLSGLKAHDLQSYWVYLAVNLAFSALFLGTKKDTGSSATALYMLAVLLHGACMLLASPATYNRHRFLIVCTFRGLYLAIAAYGIPLWFLHPPATFAAACGVAIIGSGVIMCNYISLGMLVPLKVHLPLQLLAVAMYAALLNSHTCLTLHSTPAGIDFIVSAWTHACRASKLLIVIFHPMPVLDLAPVTPNPFAMCFNVVTFLQLLVCFLLPTAAVYIMERGARRLFLARNYPAPPPRAPTWHQGIAASVTALFSACVVVVVIWEVLVTIVTVMHFHGLLQPPGS